MSNRRNPYGEFGGYGAYNGYPGYPGHPISYGAPSGGFPSRHRSSQSSQSYPPPLDPRGRQDSAWWRQPGPTGPQTPQRTLSMRAPSHSRGRDSFATPLATPGRSNSVRQSSLASLGASSIDRLPMGPSGRPYAPTYQTGPTPLAANLGTDVLLTLNSGMPLLYSAGGQRQGSASPAEFSLHSRGYTYRRPQAGQPPSGAATRDFAVPAGRRYSPEVPSAGYDAGGGLRGLTVPGRRGAVPHVLPPPGYNQYGTFQY